VVGNELEQEIISLYIKDISSIYSINQIAHRLRKKYPYINKKVTALINNKIFKKTIIGRSYLCSLNLENDETIYLLILNEIKKKKTELKLDEDLQKVLEYINKIKKIISLQLVLKSKNKILFVLSKPEDKELFGKAIVKEVMKNYKLETHTEKSFLKELLKNNELQENHVILYGYEKYYEYIKEIEDELKIKYSKLIP